MNLREITISLPALLVGLALLAGCGAPQVRPAAVSACPPIGRVTAEAAFASVRATLAEPRCHIDYAAYEAELIAVARGNPDRQNRRRFHDFWLFSVQQGILGERQASERYSRMFTTSYHAALPDGLSTCGLGRRKDRVLERLADEARTKKIGMMEISDDRESWFAAKRQHDRLAFVLEVTMLACADRVQVISSG